MQTEQIVPEVQLAHPVLQESHVPGKVA